MGERCDDISLTQKASRRVLLSSFLFLGPDSLPHPTLFIRRRTADRHPTSSKRYDNAVIARDSRLPGGREAKWHGYGAVLNRRPPARGFVHFLAVIQRTRHSDTSTSPPHAPGHPSSSTTRYIPSRDGWTSPASSYRPRPQSIPPVSTRPSPPGGYSTFAAARAPHHYIRVDISRF